MPGAAIPDDIELIIEDVGGGGGTLPPAPGGRGGGGDGDGDGDDKRHRPRGQSSLNPFRTGMIIAIVAILMFFMALAAAFLVLKFGHRNWTPVHIPPLLWFNTVVLLTSSATLEMARKRLSASQEAQFRNWWLVTTVLGVLFLAGQLLAWRQLTRQGIYLASNAASSFFYIFTGAHALHLLGGVLALIYVAYRNYATATITRSVAAEITSYYWHFLDALWLFLLVLLFVGK